MNEPSRKLLPALAQGMAAADAADTSALDARIRALLADRGATASAALASALCAPLRTVQYRLGRLAAQGHLAQPKRGVWELTVVGRRAAIAAAVPSLASVDVHGVLAKLPPWHAAMVRLGVGAAISRRALASDYPTNWPTLIAIGRTKTGKTLIGWVVCRILGLDPTAQIRLLSFETAGSVGIRRTQRAGGDFEATLASLLREPFVVFDELDKAPPEVRRAVGAVLLGQSVMEVEGTRLEVRATPLVTLNDDRGRDKLLSEAHLRRAVVLNTRAPALRQATRDLDEAAHDLERSEIRPLPVDLTAPAAQLPEAARDHLRALILASLTELGWERVDVEPLARIALGYWALDSRGGPALAAARVALDYLLCTSTCEGELRDDWDSRFATAASALVTDPQLRDALEAVSKHRAVARAVRQADLEGSRSADLALAARRAELLAVVDSAIRGGPRRLAQDERAVRAAAVAKGRVLAEWVRAGASTDELVSIGRHVETEVVAPLRQIIAARETAAENARRQHEAQAERRRREQDDRRRVARVVAHLRRLYRRRRTKPGEDVLGTLLSLHCIVERSETYVVEVEPSLVERAADAVAGAVRSFWRGNEAPSPSALQVNDPYGLSAGVFLGAPLPSRARTGGVPPANGPVPRYERRVRTWYEDRSGRTYGASDLCEWGALAVRAAIEAAAVTHGQRLAAAPAGYGEGAGR